MFDIVVKIFYFIFILPIFIVTEGYKRLKKFMAHHGLHPDWAYAWLILLIVLLVLVLIFQYGYYR